MKNDSLLTADQIKAERLSSMCGTFARADTTLMGQDVTVDLVDEPGTQTPGYSIGRKLYLNLPHIGSLDGTDDIIKVTGLNFHELAHAMFTPDKHSALVKRLQRGGLFRFFNMLEDQRIETLLSAQYSSMKPYFVMTIVQYIASPKGNLGGAHCLTHGRKFLPADIRKALRDRYDHPEHLTELEAIIDQYRLLVLPRDDEKAFQLVQAYSKLLRGTSAENQGDPYGHDSHQRPAGGVPDEQAQEDAAERAKSGADQADDQADDSDDDTDGDSGGGASDDQDSDDSNDDGQGSGGDGDSDGDDDDADTNSSGGGSGDDDADGDDDGSSADDQQGCDGEAGSDGPKESNNSKKGKDGKGKGGNGAGGDLDHRVDPAVVDKAIRDALNKVADSAKSDKQVQQDARSKEASIKSGSGQIPKLPVQQYHEMKVDPAYAFASLGMQRQLEKLWADMDPGWDQYKASGRINLRRAMLGDPIDTVFDQWNEGKADATSLEVVVLFDFSSSMNRMMTEANQALWSIKKAVEAVRGDVTVVGFNHSGTTMYTKEEKSKRDMYRHFGASGTTNPTEAFDQARYLFHYSEKKHKVLIMITDGSWSNVDANNKTIELFKQHGIITSLVYLGFNSAHYGANGIDWNDPYVKMHLTHGVDIFQGVSEPKELVDFASSIVQRAMTS